MQNPQRLLFLSLMIIVALAAIPALKVIVSSYSATSGSGKFKYRFDKTRLPILLATLGILAFVTFCYGLLIARDVAIAAQFCLGTVAFGGIGLTISICYVRK